jgi:hypothetical protein
LDGVQIRIPQGEPHADRLAGKRADVAAAFPSDGPLKRIAN